MSASLVPQLRIQNCNDAPIRVDGEFVFTPTDAYCLVSTCPDFRIHVYQMCKIRKLEHVAGAEIPKKYLQ